MGRSRSAGRVRPMAVIVLLILLLAALAAVAHRRPRAAAAPPPATVERQIRMLTATVEELQQAQRMPAEILNRSRQSVGYIYGEYSFTIGASRQSHATRFSGTGFVVGPGLVATNRHVAQPWFEDEEAKDLVAQGAVPHLDKLMVFFPGVQHAVVLTAPLYSSSEDLALLHFDPRRVGRELPPLQIASGIPVPGDSVVLVGYPMGLAAMVAKSPNPVYRRLAYSNRDARTAKELAQLSLIRPSATVGHLGDVVEDKLIYDAVTAQGGSGGPLFNMRGEVIGINTAYLDGFSGSTLGISVSELQPLLGQAARPALSAPSVHPLTTAASKQR